MIKADATSLRGLNQSLQRQLDDYLLRTNEIFKLKDALSDCFSQAQAGSFDTVLDRIKGCRFDVETEIMEIKELIKTMIEAADNYNSIRF